MAQAAVQSWPFSFGIGCLGPVSKLKSTVVLGLGASLALHSALLWGMGGHEFSCSCRLLKDLLNCTEVHLTVGWAVVCHYNLLVYS